jgi:tRNA pseudouridine38-40 synthase
MTRPSSPSKQRIALVIQYLGSRFHGWQRQPNFPSVQEEIELAIAKIVGQSVNLHGAGRTDAGVHAAAQVAHFDDPVGQIPAQRWSKVLNGQLPQGILIRGSATVDSDWHARFSAMWRRYRYSIYTDKWPNLFAEALSWHYYRFALEENKIKQAMETLLGKHHLAAFHRAGSHRSHSWVEIQEVACYRRGPMVYLEIQANGFLYGMVRLLVGLLVEVGSGQRSLANFNDIWVNQRRDLVKYAAPAKGLCLLRVGYENFPFHESLWFDSQPQWGFTS